MHLTAYTKGGYQPLIEARLLCLGYTVKKEM